MALARLTSARTAGLAVAVTVGGMLVGTALVLGSSRPAVGWLVFTLSFGGWLAAALLALRAGWQRGWFDH